MFWSWMLSVDLVVWHCRLFQQLKAHMNSSTWVSIDRPVFPDHICRDAIHTQCLLSCRVLHGSWLTRDLGGNQANNYDMPEQHYAAAIEGCMDGCLYSHQI
jgi:hypothetical protein